MKEAIYLKRNMALINYTKAYYTTVGELLSSDGFALFLGNYLNFLSHTNPELFQWLKRGLPTEEVKKDLIRLMKVIQVLEIDEIAHSYFSDREKMLAVIEDCYHFWRNMQRYSIIYTRNEEGLQLANFMEADAQFHQMILNFYRTVQQKVQGSKNRVYRQLQAGTNASLLLRDYVWPLPQAYQKLAKIPFVHTIMLRTPLIIHPRSNKRLGMFSEAADNPIHEFAEGDEEWMCFPLKVGSLLCYTYFHRDFTAGAVALANLFELASDQDCIGMKPDLLLLFGNPDGRQDTVFYHDTDEKIWVGKVSYGDVIEYFGYLKKMILTLHNLAMIEKGWLPLHGAMINLTLEDGTKKGVIMIGDSGAGKSETIEALTNLSEDIIVSREIVFDDMGSLHLNAEGKIRAQGTEIGAFVRLDDLDKGSAYRDMDRSIFFNPESANARVVVPAAPYSTVITDQKVDLFLYANNYTDQRGLRAFANKEEAMQTFIEGKRFALGTTQEKGLSTTFFANPFGPMQKQEACLKIIDQLFDQLIEQNIFLGEIFTGLGLPEKGGNALELAARELLAKISEK